MKKIQFIPKKDSRGSIIVSILMVTMFLTVIIFSILILSNANLSRSRSRVLLLQAQYSAESGADAAIAILNSGNESYTGTSTDVEVLNNTQYKATYSVSVAAGSSGKEKIITATGKVYAPKNSASPTQTRRIEILAQRNSTTSALSMMSRNIFETGSSVKDIQIKDIFVNNFINFTKNTNNLIAENITVADKNTGASNCSIGGPGTLSKPGSFTTPGQTKTSIKVAYNNCISPPGNSSNTDFDVLANQTNIAKITSTYIPWSQFMDNSYLDAGSCNDWSNGSSPRDIPSAGNTKKTHYPDSASNISSSCGSSGDLALGSAQYNIKDHVHLRANLCASSACSPVFYNPDSGAAGIKYIFVEGNVNFDRVTTASGSGPIVLVVYGADPASKASVCPYGGAFYLNSGETSAAALYVLATNGVCLDKTKFSANPALGGITGKNIYIATNSGSPHDLHLDINFPYSSIPIDLTWKAVRYHRL